jgi:glycogen operon protein
MHAQDNATGWLDWSGLQRDPAFADAVRQLLALRNRLAIFRQPQFRHGDVVDASGVRDIDWLRTDGSRMQPDDWVEADTIFLLLAAAAGGVLKRVALLMNPTLQDKTFLLPPQREGCVWQALFSSTAPVRKISGNQRYIVSPRSLSLLLEEPLD